MDISQLRYFVAVVDAGSLSRAASALHMSQPALSQRMAQLERDLDVRLLDRGPRGVRATGIGQELYRDAHRLLRQFDELARGVTQRHPVRGLVAVGLPSAAAAHLAAPLFALTRRTFPGVHLELFESMSSYIEELFSRGRMDLALRYRTDRTAPAGETPLYSEDLYLVGDAGRASESDEEIRLADLAGVPLVAPGVRSGLRSLIDQTFADHGIVPTVVADVESLATMVRIAESGDACAILPRSCVGPGAASPAVRRIVDPVVERHVTLRRARDLSAPHDAVTAVERAIVEVVAELSAHDAWPGTRPATKESR
ncbi:LysR substrate-binding domain-containing protein [Nocardioides sp. LHG3406-4]|uniref:LysR substrate-binding domain-containing protein n=1 Tax=Nocardioides sp. LHG3406-4 TaxID=2804575 RepID=UPI003CE8F3F1